jgi:hypothetical protein
LRQLTWNPQGGKPPNQRQVRLMARLESFCTPNATRPPREGVASCWLPTVSAASATCVC